jgi:hypothetical protein
MKKVKCCPLELHGSSRAGLEGIYSILKEPWRGPYGALEFHEESLHVGNIEKV